MPRSGAAARDRLERAALELYRERGYDQTTIAEIAARAGVTQRTFFRHFGDKREVLFHIELRQQRALAAALADVPAAAPPLTAVLLAFRSMAPGMEINRALAEARHHVIAATPALRERELAKAAALSIVVADALRGRGLPPWRATLLAEVSTAALGHAVHTWVADASADLDALIVRAFTELRAFADVTVPSA
ncbi:TetR/AcrR family transcriptional regulator [Mangrovihabitans endophyticus]|uniref:TetR family transcriptional regulator n=1 Tax=Mangrovihabitans endophyticus TaxID=1751298 RepID=A0A8J3BT20_9ACTN|nr:TetR/AcrR family transcriptional regulator [Mangrovihabitans endophyticus]GGK74936.1 TetR family transcriptional regulator [Mangrovihabitans endophyticus]